eukprot:930246-Heterocapsa_arctica.AAC.1
MDSIRSVTISFSGSQSPLSVRRLTRTFEAVGSGAAARWWAALALGSRPPSCGQFSLRFQETVAPFSASPLL